MCEQKIVTQDGFTTEELFASVPPLSYIDTNYLARLGIPGLGLRLLLLRLHQRLHQKHHGDGAAAAAEDADTNTEDDTALGKRKLT